MIRLLLPLLLLLQSLSLAYAGNSEIDCITRMVYFEARGEAPQARKAVTHVLFNRMKHKEFSNTACGNLKPSQYQWVRSKPKVRDKETYDKLKEEAIKEYKLFKASKHRDITNKSYFFTSNGRKPAPRAYRTMKVGRHTFYGLRERS